ncbi:hypothetical protein [Cohnella hashimotonis]|uniref:Uncharacterized protein n=1 Tax=Cohnella hashimotonis TaxID=2826895 RepID=A0ABT6TLB7_9BACL|nr:hypothetical protein [Cohnella hashimotonis]MDI4647610.1 hypothetical protein [Cohnella hashimotonis]
MIPADAVCTAANLASIDTVLPMAAGQTKADPTGDPLSVSPHDLQYAAHALHMPYVWRDGAR